MRCAPSAERVGQIAHHIIMIRVQHLLRQAGYAMGYAWVTPGLRSIDGILIIDDQTNVTYRNPRLRDPS
jgi:PAS domain-containing protein